MSELLGLVDCGQKIEFQLLNQEVDGKLRVAEKIDLTITEEALRTHKLAIPVRLDFRNTGRKASECSL